jgi:proline iminopeptidase
LTLADTRIRVSVFYEIGRQTMHTIVNGTRIWFDVEGAGLVPDGLVMRHRPTLVLLHGGPGFDHSSFKPAHSALADVAQILYVDHRGNGRSGYSEPAHWNLAQWADDLRGLFDRLGIERPVVLGLSFGGFVAQSLAIRHPDHVGRLVLSSTAAKFRLDRCLDTFLRLHGTRAREVAEAFWHAAGDADKVRDYIDVCFPLYNPTPRSKEAAKRSTFNPAMLRHFFEAGGEGFRFDFRDRLKDIRCPTLVLGGDLDPVTPIADSDDIAAALPPALMQYERFAGAGHNVGHDQPERYFTVLRDFVGAAD